MIKTYTPKFTRTQELTLCALIQRIWANELSTTPEGRLEVKEAYCVPGTCYSPKGRALLFLSITTGMTNDEGTGAFFARTHRHISIGPNGACKLLNARKGFKSKARGFGPCTYLPTEF